jgi:hypothetical protein
VAVASPILRETIKKLKDRRALLEKQVKGPLEELRQIEEDLKALEAAAGGRTRTRPASAPRARARAPRGANLAVILRAIRDGATTPAEIATKTGLAAPRVNSSLTSYVNRQKLVTRGMNGLTLTQRGRQRLRELESR